MDFSSIIKGSEHFKNKDFKKYKNKFIDLVKNGQHPKVLFIGCSDSRVVPNLITQSEPGDLFVMRNIGNFVPPFKPDVEFHGTAAAIEYAVSILKVTDIIVCGHSHCGAIKGVYQRDELNKEELIHVHKWLELGLNAKRVVEEGEREHGFSLTMEKKLTLTEKISVVFSLNNLLTYPKVEERVKTGELFLRGWYYRIEDGEIEYYDDEKSEFSPLN
jgi:carbonic anhydrase